ncbi:flagellin [Bacillus thuringiensis]|uniref:flagellin N-terminal helical domain-containing protein n=1 Tax=Bacillus TaxID=1386 RepID=UPI000BF374E6|nr:MULTISPECIES: flagellin [Bacillus]AXR16189.1 flagellin [Bacillus sp. CR71]AXR21923.1 flagellin [Bacillus sp. E25]KAB2420641.1 flagellin [Bacillus cereus]PFQ88655.1 flagellin [Bacillus thuringiensis]PGK63821.1 flagellin [Bacillus thuringiensis]
MRINTNINSMRTQEYMRQNQAKMSTAMDRLSSGKRINNASDDAAGLAIATRMRARESGLGVAANNTQDGISLIRTADSAMNSVSNILLRMRDLANQSANGTNTDKNQGALDKEFAALKEQIDYISKNTEFNDKKLLDGSNKAIAIQTLDSDDKGKQIDISLSDSSTTALKINNLSIAANGLGIGSGNKLVGVADNTIANASADALSKLDGTTGDTDTKRTAAVKAFTDQYKDLKVAMNAKDVETIDAAIKKFEGENTLENAKAIGAAFKGAAKATLTADITTADTASKALSDLDTNSTTDSRKTAMKAFVAEFDKVKGSMNSSDVTRISDAIDRFSKTDDSGNTLEAARAIGDAFKAATTDGKTSTATDANSAIKAIDEALETIASNRATLGATLNRLDFNVNNLKNQASSMASAASQVEDADMAKEMSEMTKFKILNEAGISMLSQANQTPQMVSKLLQ